MLRRVYGTDLGMKWLRQSVLRTVLVRPLGLVPVKLVRRELNTGWQLCYSGTCYSGLRIAVLVLSRLPVSVLLPVNSVGRLGLSVTCVVLARAVKLMTSLGAVLVVQASVLVRIRCFLVLAPLTLIARLVCAWTMLLGCSVRLVIVPLIVVMRTCRRMGSFVLSRCWLSVSVSVVLFTLPPT